MVPRFTTMLSTSLIGWIVLTSTSIAEVSCSDLEQFLGELLQGRNGSGCRPLHRRRGRS